MDAEHSSKENFCDCVKAPNVDIFMGQHILQCNLVIPIKFFGQEDHRMQDAIGQRRGNQIGAPHRKGSGNLVCGQPILDIRRVVGDRHSELPHTPKIGYGEVDCQQQHANQPEYLKGRNVFCCRTWNSRTYIIRRRTIPR